MSHTQKLVHLFLWNDSSRKEAHLWERCRLIHHLWQSSFPTSSIGSLGRSNRTVHMCHLSEYSCPYFLENTKPLKSFGAISNLPHSSLRMALCSRMMCISRRQIHYNTHESLFRFYHPVCRRSDIPMRYSHLCRFQKSQAQLYCNMCCQHRYNVCIGMVLPKLPGFCLSSFWGGSYSVYNVGITEIHSVTSFNSASYHTVYDITVL